MVESEEGAGSTFAVRLPISAGRIEQSRTTSSAGD